MYMPDDGLCTLEIRTVQKSFCDNARRTPGTLANLHTQNTTSLFSAAATYGGQTTEGAQLIALRFVLSTSATFQPFLSPTGQCPWSVENPLLQRNERVLQLKTTESLRKALVQ